MQSWTAPVFDAFGGPVLLLMAGGGACLIAVGVVARRWPGLLPRLTAAAVTGSLLLAAFFVGYPGAIASAYAAVDPLVASVCRDQVADTMSIHMLFVLEPERIVGIYAPLVLTLVLAAVVTWRAAPELRFRWMLGASVLAALFATGLWQMRGAAVTTMVA